jgi:formylglycine-generating enzyme required for sulfatase activity
MTFHVSKISLLAVALAVAPGHVAAAGPPIAPVARCAPDAVAAGTVCLDRWEASVWRVPDPRTVNAALVRRIQLGKATRADLAAAGAVQLGTDGDDWAPCGDDGQTCAGDVYAASLPSVRPAAFVTWFQAEEACANSGKRLPTSAEWQVGANGSPDPGPEIDPACNVVRGVTAPTGTHPGCVSARGAFDMVGNVAEWVADWGSIASECPGWGFFSDDIMCLAGAAVGGHGPGALVRGGFSFGGALAGPLAVVGTIDATRAEDFLGFRCAR